MIDHRALLFSSTAELVEHAAALHSEGPSLVLGCRTPLNSAIGAALPPGAVVKVVDRPLTAERPAAAVAAVERLAGRADPASTGQVVVLTEPDYGESRDGLVRWRRFEAACNLIPADRPLTLVCAFDTGATPNSVLSAVEESHDDPRDPRTTLLRLHCGAPAPPPPTDPVLSVTGSRRIADLGPIRLRLSDALSGTPTLVRTDFVAAVNEVLTNAYLHGRPPIDTLLWVDDTRVECRVIDRGTGLHDPGAGYGPAVVRSSRRTGMGLWLARQTCDELDTWRGPATFTVRLVSALTGGPGIRHSGALARAETAHTRARAVVQRLDGRTSPARPSEP